MHFQLSNAKHGHFKVVSYKNTLFTPKMNQHLCHPKNRGSDSILHSRGRPRIPTNTKRPTTAAVVEQIGAEIQPLPRL